MSSTFKRQKTSPSPPPPLWEVQQMKWDELSAVWDKAEKYATKETAFRYSEIKRLREKLDDIEKDTKAEHRRLHDKARPLVKAIHTKYATLYPLYFPKQTS